MYRNEKSKLVSVIMPVYKASEYIEKAIRGVLNQTYSNLELIIIDDNDDNSCLNIINQINDHRIKYFRGNNEGIVGARNYAISLAMGTFIANMDADDVYDPTRIEKQIYYLIDNKLDICGTWIKFFGSGDFRILKNPIFDRDIKFSLLYSSPIANPSVLGYAYIFKNNKYQKSQAEDYNLWTQLALQNIKFGNIPEVLTNYRIHDEQTTITKFQKVISDSIAVANNYSIIYNEESHHKILKKYNFLFNNLYKTHEVKELVKTFAKIVNKNQISKDAFHNVIDRCFIKLENPNIKTYLLYIKYLRNYKLSIFNLRNLNILVQSVLKLKKNGYIYNKLKKLSF